MMFWKCNLFGIIEFIAQVGEYYYTFRIDRQGRSEKWRKVPKEWARVMLHPLKDIINYQEITPLEVLVLTGSTGPKE